MKDTTFIEVIPTATVMLVMTVILLYCIALGLHVVYKKTASQWAEEWSLYIETCADMLGIVTAMYIIITYISQIPSL